MSTAKAETFITRALAKIAGQPVELTVRSPTKFTWSLERMDAEAAERLAKFARQDPRATVRVENDPEIGSFVYLSVTEPEIKK